MEAALAPAIEAVEVEVVAVEDGPGSDGLEAVGFMSCTSIDTMLITTVVIVNV
jgi:hypothetical protein